MAQFTGLSWVPVGIVDANEEIWMKRGRRQGRSKRDRWRSHFRLAEKREQGPAHRDASVWHTLRRLLNPVRYLGVNDDVEGYDIELFVTRLEERRVLNGDLGLLAGVADITDMELDSELYGSSLYDGDALAITQQDFGANHSIALTQANDLRAVLNDGGADGQRRFGGGLLAASQAEGEANAAPVFAADSFAFDLLENTDVGTLVGTAAASDPDSPVLQYSITGGDPAGAFAINDATGDITVADKSAIDFETNPTFTLTVRVDDNHAMSPMNDIATVNIALENLQTSLSIKNASDVESSGVLVFDVDAVGNDINQSFDVSYRTTDGSAVDALSTLGTNDYDGTTTGVLSFAGNSASETQTIAITLNDDSVVEADETLLVNLLSTTSNDVDISVADGTGTITNDDTTVILVSDVVKEEGNSGTTNFLFFISSSNLATENITLTANTVDGTAMAGTDYTAIASPLVTILAGSNSATLAVQVNGDTDVEMTETFSVVLSNGSYAGTVDTTRVTVGNSGTGAILDDDLANRATLSINDVTMVEGDTGTTGFEFTIESNITAQEDISVTVKTSDLFDAVGGADYTALTNHVAVITKGSMSTMVTVDVTGESELELDETFAVTLSDPLFNGVSDTSRVILGDETGVGTIVNDDSAAISINNVSVVEGDSGVTNLEFTVSSNVVGSRDIDFRINTMGVDATAGTDYAEIVAQTGVISAGSLSTDVTVAVIGDTVVEADEMLSVLLSSARFNGSADALRVTIADDTGEGTITDDDSTTISIADVTMLEGDAGFTSFVFTLTSTAFTGEDIDVTVNTANGVEAVAGTDYAAIINGTATIAAGSNTGTLTVNVVGEGVVELQEDFSVTISDAKFAGASNPTKVTIADADAIGTILDDDVASISIGDVAVHEGNAGTTTFSFTISSDVAASRELTVKANTADRGEAIAGTDYTAVTDFTATIGVGSTSTMVTVDVVGDPLVEFDERFDVILSDAKFAGSTDPMQVGIGDAEGIGTILNDDTAILSIDDVSMAEDGTFTFTITSSNPTDTDITGTVDTANIAGEAVAGFDYAAISGATFTISGDSVDRSDTVTVTVTEDNIVEDDEDFDVNLSNALFAGAVDATRATFIGGDASGRGTITNNDTAALSINDVSLAEDGTFTFTITSSNPTDTDITGTVDTANIAGEAVAGADYTAISGATFTIGGDSVDRSDTVTVTVTDDNIVEDDEDFNVNLSNPLFGGGSDATRATFTGGDAVGLGTIENNDTAALSINDVSLAENGTFTFAITSSNPTETDITGTVDTSDIAGEALAGIDYTAISGATFTISGDSVDRSDTVTVTVTDDNIVEDDEDFNVNLSSVLFGGAIDDSRATYTGGDASGVGTIENNDTAILSINDVSLAEDGTFTFTVTSSKPTDTEITGTVDTADILGEAVAGSDYVAISGATFTISGDSVDRSDTVTVAVTDDNIVEDDEDFSVNLSNALFGGGSDATRATFTGGDASGLGTIENNDTAILSINDISAFEDGTFTFTITSSNPTEIDITGTVATANITGEAVAGTDYTAISGAVFTISGDSVDTTDNVTVTVIDDDIVEDDEDFNVNLSNALFAGGVDTTRATIAVGGGTGTGTILNDDVVSLTIDDVTMVEGDEGTTKNYQFTITSDAVASENIEVAINTADLDAVGGTDFTAITAGTALIAAGDNTTTVIVTVTGDGLVEVDEAFEVQLSGGKFAGNLDPVRVVFADGVGTGTIENDDSASITIGDVSQVEGDGGLTSFMFTISTSAAASEALTVTVNTNDPGEAVEGTDFAPVTNEIATIAAGATSVDVVVSVLGEEVVELDETFEVKLSDAKFNGAADITRVTIGDDTATGTIQNDDTAALSIGNLTIDEGNSGDTTVFMFTVTSDKLSSRELGFTVNTANGTALAGTDYTAVSGVPGKIDAGSLTTMVMVSVTGDDLVEPDETFSVILSDALFAEWRRHNTSPRLPPVAARAPARSATTTWPR